MSLDSIRRRKKGTQEMFDIIMAENFPKIMKDTNKD